jgi:mRNA-degrading endonuclease RelE of RelBE toxin-antitoxin system
MRESERQYLTFIETPVFTKHIDSKASLEVLTAIQDELLENPTRGAIVKGTGGARKARIADPKENRGKSGSYRYLYLYLEQRGRIHLLYFYGKNEQDNLSEGQKKIVANLVGQIKGVAE